MRVARPALVLKIADLLADTEGHDWSVRSAALEALANLGPRARCAVPRLLALAREIVGEQDESGYPSDNALLADALGRIGDDRPEVIEGLRLLVAQHQFRASPSAVAALGRLGRASLPSLDTVLEYLRSEWDPVDDEESARTLLEAVIGIAGRAHPGVRAYVEHLRSSPLEDVQEVARKSVVTTDDGSQ